MAKKRTCELPFCKGIVEGTRNKRRCDNDRNIHLHRIISKNVKKIMKYIEGVEVFTANDVNKALFKDKLDKNEKGSMYRLFQAMVRENYIEVKGKVSGLKAYAVSEEAINERKNKSKKTTKKATKQEAPKAETKAAPKAAAPVSKPEEPKAPKQSPEEILLSILKNFVYEKHGQWNHHDWEDLINKPEIKQFGLSHGDIGRILEEEKIEYWKERNG